MPGKLIVDEIEDSGGTSVIGRKNAIINGNFDIWQRGTSFTGSKYTSDRWDVVASGTGTTTTSQQAFTLGQTDVPNEPKYYLRIAKSSGVSGATGGDVLTQKVESVRTFAGQTATLSFYAKASEATTIDFFLKQHFGTGGSPSSDVDHTPTGVSVTTSWQKFTVTQAFTSISGKTIGSNNDDYLELIMRIDNGSNASVDFAQVQWEKGSVATDFERQHPGDILLQCRRYFHKVTIWHGTYATFPSGFCTGNGNGTGTARMTYEDPSMQNFRTSPTATLETTNNTSGSYRIFRLHDNSSNDSQTVQSVGFDLVEWFDGATNHGLCQMTVLWGTGATTGNFTNQAHYRINSIANSPKVRVLLDAEL